MHPANPAATMGTKELRAAVLRGVAAGRPEIGPQQVHIDITNGCNAACVTCWDHSPLLTTPRTAAWKRRRLSLAQVLDLLAQLDALGSVRAVVLSGMGYSLTHPDVYEMMAAVKARGWHLTVLSNLLAADIDRLCAAGVDNLLVGVQGATPDVHSAFHPGWNENHFFNMCRYLRRLTRAQVPTRHVQVINRDTAPEVVEMVRFGRMFGAERVNYKLASLYGGTEAASATPEQLRWLADEGVPRARDLAGTLGVKTNLDLFQTQVAAGLGQARATTDIAATGCFMGFAYTRITVDLDVLYCCNTQVRVGNLDETGLAELWWGPKWQALRDHVRGGRYFAGCEVCGKYEQNVKWAARVRDGLGDAAWAGATGQASTG